MPIFRYKGYRADGSSAAGTIEAEGLQDAVASLKSRNILPRTVTEYTHRQSRFSFGAGPAGLLPHVTRQMSTLISSGVSLMDTLKTLSEEGSGYWKGLLVDLRDKVAGGSGLSRAMEGFRNVFPDFYINMVAAGERSGSLDKVLGRLADFLEKDTEVRARVRVAMIYPTFMMCTGFAVMSFLFTFVIPKIVRIFENTKSALPLPTVILIGVSNFFIHYWWLVAGLAIALAYGFRWVRARRRSVLDRALLSVPGGVVQSLYYARFTRSLGFLLEGGIPMLKALELSARSTGNVVIEAVIHEAVKKVAEGARLSASLEGFPPILLQLISTGEKTGGLVEVLSNAAASYENEFDRRTQKALALLEPAMILFMAVVVGFIVLAVLLPMFQLNQLVK